MKSFKNIYLIFDIIAASENPQVTVHGPLYEQICSLREIIAYILSGTYLKHSFQFQEKAKCKY